MSCFTTRCFTWVVGHLSFRCCHKKSTLAVPVTQTAHPEGSPHLSGYGFFGRANPLGEPEYAAAGNICIKPVMSGDLVARLCLFLFVAFVFCGTAKGSPPDRQWTAMWGDTLADEGEACATDNNGNLYGAGASTIASDTDFALFRMSPQGSNVWSQKWGSIMDDRNTCVLVDGLVTSIYVAGYTYGDFSNMTCNGETDVTIASFNSTGAMEWVRMWGSTTSDYAYGVSMSPDGQMIYVAGSSKGAISGSCTNTGGEDAFICRRLNNGDAAPGEWATMWGTANDDCAMSVFVDSNTNVFVAGYSDGVFPGQTNYGGWDGFLSRLDATGGVVWTRQFGGTSNDFAESVVMGPGEDLFVCGYTYGTIGSTTNMGYSDPFMARFDKDGEHLWTAQWGSTVTDYAYDAAIDEYGGIIALGITYGEWAGETNNNGSQDVFITKISQTGSNQWSRIWGSSVTDFGNGLATWSTSVYSIGYTTGTIDGQSPTGSTDIFVSRWNQNPDPGFLGIDVTPSNGAWTVDVAPPGYTGPTAGTGDLASVVVPLGSYTVTFLPIPTHTTPASETKDVFESQLTVFTGAYAAASGTFSVDVDPDSASWVLSSYPAAFTGPYGGAGDLAATTADPGSYAVTYQPLAGYITPSSETYLVTGGQNTGFTGIYTRAYGWIDISVSPSNGTWVMTNHPSDYTGPTSGTGDLSLEPAPAGEYSVSFGAVIGYSTPLPWNGSVTNDGVWEVDAVYTPLDSDGDWLTDPDESNIYGTDPYNPDTDGDGYFDGVEVSEGTDPLNPDSYPRGNMTMLSPTSKTRAKSGRWIEISWFGTDTVATVNITLSSGTNIWELQPSLICTNSSMTSYQRIPEDMLEGTNYHVKVMDTLTNSGYCDSDMFNLYRETASDYDGDGRADPVLYFPPWGAWYIDRSTKGIREQQFGWNGPTPVPADYDGDSRTDIALYYQPGGQWYILMSTDGYRSVVYGDGTMLPAPGDYNGDGRADLCVYQPAAGRWFMSSLDGTWQSEVIFGFPGTAPVCADYDGDGVDDPALFYPVTGTWYLLCSGEGYKEQQFGWAGAIPAPADYSGDGRADYCVYEVGSGNWHVLDVYGNYSIVQFGFNGAYPVPADYDGDGVYDKCVFWGPGGIWHLLMTTDGYRENTCSWFGQIPD